MDVILREDVQDLGYTGQVVKVSPGYARNYLIPQSLAVEATRRNLKQLEHQKRVMGKRAERQLSQAATLSDKLQNLNITVEKSVGGADKLYGSVTSREIISALTNENIDGLSRKKVVLDEPIRSLGIYPVPIKLSSEHTVTIKVWVVAKV